MMKIYTRGFTLIELMIVLLIAGLLLLVAAPFTSQWSNSTKITEAMGVINQAVSRAKASALRNPNGIARVKVTGVTSVTQVAAAVCFLSGSVQVRVAAVAPDPADPLIPAKCDSGSRTGTKIWAHKLPRGVTIKNANDSNLNKGLCFDNRGLIVATCQSDGNLKITAGATNETVQYY